jgi:anaerobic glycerol-3-phosphate dehydrogenase
MALLDVLIVGCGPAGMYLAAQVAKQGLKVGIVGESCSELPTVSWSFVRIKSALHYHARRTTPSPTNQALVTQPCTHPMVAALTSTCHGACSGRGKATVYIM